MELHKTELFAKMLLTDNKRLAHLLNRFSDVPLGELEEKFPGLIKAAKTAIREVEEHRLVVEALLHKGNKIQARTSETYGCHASNWVHIAPN
jgi:hypothetical protein